jgi:hypothetical protein
VIGASVPVFVVPSLSARVAYHTTGIRFYEHHLLTDGIAASRFTLGDDLGHEAVGWYLTLRWAGTEGISIVADGAREDRNNDTYEAVYTDSVALRGFVFRQLATLPHEGRVRGTVSMQYLARDGREFVQLTGGIERVTNYDFVVVPASIHGVVSLSVAIFR